MSKQPSDQIVSLSQIKIACENCALHRVCLPVGISREDMQKLEDIIRRRRPLKRGEHLYYQEDRFTSIFALRSGSMKIYNLDDDGTEQITGFVLPGDLIGLDAISPNNYPNSARALESTSVCEVPFAELEKLSAHLPSLHHQILRMMSNEIYRDEHKLLLLGKSTAKERLAAFLIDFSNRVKARGYSAKDFRLSMSRIEIGNYLGLAVETVSRLFTKFQENKLLYVRGKDVHLSNLEALHEIVGARERTRDGVA